MKLLRALGVIISTTVIYLGLVYLGWGLAGGWQDFFAAAPRQGYAACAALFALLVGAQAYRSLEGIQDSPGQKEKTVRRQTFIGQALVLLLLFTLIFLPFTSRKEAGIFTGSPLLAWAGVALCLLGYLLIFWSGLALGRQYSAEVTIQKDHRLITSGPYSLVRHPRYLGILCLALGAALLFHSWIGLGLCPLAAALIWSRVHDEETLLSQEFGAQWAEYCRRSWRLVPYVY